MDDIDSSNETAWVNPSTWWPRFPPTVWLRTSCDALESAERQILNGVWSQLKQRFVLIDSGRKSINTVMMNQKSQRMPIVLVHGMGAGVGMWALNYEAIGKHRPVYAFDILGFGHSSRAKFASEPTEIEDQFVESMEDWRRQLNLSKFVLLGHSMGGYLAAAYAMKYPDRIRHLVLVDPWGFADKAAQSEDTKNKRRIPWPVQQVAKLFVKGNPLAVLRALGPCGPSAVNRFRGDIVGPFDDVFPDDTVAKYIYHANAQVPSGEAGFRHMNTGFGWAVNPMLPRMDQLAEDIPVTMIYGGDSWMDNRTGYKVKRLRKDSYVHVAVIKGAGHHVYSHQATLFNESVNRVCSIVDHGLDLNTNHPADAYRNLRIKLRELERSHSTSSMTTDVDISDDIATEEDLPGDSSDGSQGTGSLDGDSVPLRGTNEDSKEYTPVLVHVEEKDMDSKPSS